MHNNQTENKFKYPWKTAPTKSYFYPKGYGYTRAAVFLTKVDYLQIPIEDVEIETNRLNLPNNALTSNDPYAYL